MPHEPTDTLFMVSTEKSLRSLAVWLESREFNSVFPHLKDKKGQRMIGLSMIRSRRGHGYDRRGKIIVANPDLVDRVVELAKEKMVKEMTNG